MVTIAELVAAFCAVGVVVLALTAGYWLGALRERRRNQALIAQDVAALYSKVKSLDEAIDEVIDLHRATRVRVSNVETLFCTSRPASASSPERTSEQQQATETALQPSLSVKQEKADRADRAVSPHSWEGAQ